MSEAITPQLYGIRGVLTGMEVAGGPQEAPNLKGLSRKTLTLTEGQEGVSKEVMKECFWQGGKSFCKGPGVGESIPRQIYHKQPGTMLVL